MNINMKESRDRMERAWSKYAHDTSIELTQSGTSSEGDTGSNAQTAPVASDKTTSATTGQKTTPKPAPPQVTYLHDPDKNIYLQHVFYPDEGRSVLKAPGYENISTVMSPEDAKRMYDVKDQREWGTQANIQFTQRKQEYKNALAAYQARQNPESYISDQGAVMHRDSHGGYMERDSEGNLTGKIVGGDLARRRGYGVAQTNWNPANSISYVDKYKHLQAPMEQGSTSGTPPQTPADPHFFQGHTVRQPARGPGFQDLMRRRDESNRSVNAKAKAETLARQEIRDKEKKDWDDYVASRHLPNRGQPPKLTIFDPYMPLGYNPVKKNIPGTI